MMQVTYALSEWDRNYASVRLLCNISRIQHETISKILIIIYFGKKLKKDP